MKNKKITSLIAAGALVANLALVAAVSADTTTTMDQAISAGTLAVTELPTVASWPAVNVSLVAQPSNVSAVTNSLKFQDMRGAPGTVYTLNTVATDLLDIATGVTFDVFNLKIRGNGGATQMADLPNSTDCAGGEISVAYIAQQYTPSFVARDTDAKARAMQCQGTPDFSLNIPAQQSAGNYRTTVTWSLT